MKRILIDIYKIKDLYSGLGQFSLNFANHIGLQKESEFQIDFLIPDEVSQKKVYNAPSIRFKKANFQKRYLPFLNNQYDIWHSLHQFPSHKPAKHGTWILTIHDLNFLHEKSSRKSSAYLRKLQKNVDKADCITTISNYTKVLIEEKIDLKGKKVRVIYNGITSNDEVAPKKPAYMNDAGFFFSIGIFNRKKNFHTLIPLMQHFIDKKLVIAGNNDTAYGHEIYNQIKQFGLEDRILLPGKVSEAEKYWLYNNCDAFLFPSLAEGFGMPVIEAMKAGRPVFLSPYTSLPEIGGEAAFYFENFKEPDMALIIRKGLSEFQDKPGYYKELLEKNSQKYTWEGCVRQYSELYKEYL
ncbi:MAG TPA: glycosyltransferase family 1 protein [Lentimicrobium sp.]|nr:glycosyltransferase family 1 protein [Lentimicrobium sp.]